MIAMAAHARRRLNRQPAERSQLSEKDHRREDAPTKVNMPALILPTLSPKFNKPTARPPRTTCRCDKAVSVSRG